MSNLLKMADVQAILSLRAQRRSFRAIGLALGIHRETVARYVHLAERDSKPATAPTGSGRESDGSSPAKATAGSAPRSVCEPWRETILTKVESGLSARRIWQDLAEEPNFQASYYSVCRFVRKLGGATPLPMRRLECQPGEESQVDFGTGARIITPEGKRRKTHVFRIVLSHSRKAYSEATYRQTTEDFLRALENAFWYFGGVTRTIVIDNLRAAVSQPDWFDPELNPKLLSFCQHYGTVILPTKPRTPRHKGKIEAGVKYVKNNGLKGHTFTSLDQENRHLLRWEETVADTRIHGTTKRQVGKVFAEVERGSLLPLPQERFPFFQEAPRIVSRDGHIEVAKAYYSVPPEYLARKVWARWDGRLVRVFNGRLEQIAVHVRQEPGRFSTLTDHLAPEKISGIERGATWLLNKIGEAESQARQWAEAMLQTRGIEGVRVLMGLVALSKKHSPQALELACETALSYDAFRLRTIRQLLKRHAVPQQPLPFLDEHPIIRPLSDYGGWVRSVLAVPWGRDQRPQFPPPNPHPLPSSCSSIKEK